MSGYFGLSNDSSVGAARQPYNFFAQTAAKQDKNKPSGFLDAIGKNPEAVGTFAQMLSAAGGRGRDRGYPQSGGFGGYGSKSRMSGSGQFMTDLGGTPGYSSSSLFMPDGQGGWGGVGGSMGKRSTSDRFKSGLGGAAGGAA